MCIKSVALDVKKVDVTKPETGIINIDCSEWLTRFVGLALPSMGANEWENCEKSIEMNRISIIRVTRRRCFCVNRNK